MSENNQYVARVQEILSEALQLPADLVTPTLAFGDQPEWDSMGHMEVMMLLEERFGVEINTDTIAALISVPAICQYIEQHSNGK